MAKNNIFKKDYLTGGGFAGPFINSYREELKKTKFFLDTMETFIEESEKDEVSELEKGIENLSGAEKDEYWQWHYPIHWQEVFSNRIRSSFILQLCTFVEGELKEICNRVMAIGDVPIKVNELKGSTLTRPKKYFEAFANFEKPSSENWRSMEFVFDIRNVMIHEAGFAGNYRNYNRIQQYAKDLQGISFEYDCIEIEKVFCEYCLKEIEKFCVELHEAYEAFRVTKLTLYNLENTKKV